MAVPAVLGRVLHPWPVPHHPRPAPLGLPRRSGSAAVARRITRDSREYLKHSKERDEKFQVRGLGLIAGLVVLALGLAALVKLGPWWGLPLALAFHGGSAARRRA